MTSPQTLNPLSSNSNGLIRPQLITMPAEVQGSVLSQALIFNWECSRDALFIADCFTGTLVDVNPQAERLTGYSRDELVGKHQSMLHPHEEFNAIREDFKKSVDGTQRIFEGHHLRRNDRTVIPVSIEATPAFDVNGRMYILGNFHDVSPFVEQQHRLELKRWALDAYAKATHALAQATSSSSLIQETCAAITSNSPFALAWVGFAQNEAPYKVNIGGAAGQAIGYIKGLDIHWDENDPRGMGPTGRALRTRTVHAVDDIVSDPLYEPWRKKAFPYNLNSSITIPFQLHNDQWAVLSVYSTRWYIFSPLVIEAFTHLAESIAVGLHSLEQAERLESVHKQNEMAQEELGRTFESVGKAIVKALALHDPYTAGHQDRVAELSRAIADEMGLEHELVQAISMAAYLHDIGKISTPTEILNKPAKLTDDEMSIVREHCKDGFEILKSVPFHWPIAEMVYQHHERLDGSGYPRGLHGEQIHIGARIIAVADTVESMASPRSYRPSMGLESAFKQIESQSGKTLDESIVKTCLFLFREKGYALPPAHAI